jgi:acyl-coenzyme A thioesterase PaaI-like protein
MSDRIARVLSRLPGLREKITEEIKTLVRQPRSLAALIDSQSPWLGRQFLGVASNIVEPFLVGTGVSVTSIGEEIAEVTLPNIWRNQGERNVVHNAAIAAAAELASRLYWERHLDIRHAEMHATSVSTRMLASARETLRVVFRATINEREEVLHKLRASGEAESTSSVSVYDPSGKLIAEVEIEWTITKQLSLSGAR